MYQLIKVEINNVLNFHKKSQQNESLKQNVILKGLMKMLLNNMGNSQQC